MTKIAGFTERLLLDAGITAGMRVLDIGCGAGEVSFLVADLVGASGRIVGIDADAQAIATAHARMQERQCSNVSFSQENLSELSSLITSQTGAFDAVVGRRILMYLPDVTAVLRSIAEIILPGGLFVFQESDSTMAPGRTAVMPLHDRVVDWIWKTVEREGADIHMGFNLPETMRNAGIIVDHIRAEPVIQGQAGHYSLHFIVRAMLLRIVNQGVASAEEIDIDTLEQRLDAERSRDTVYVSDFAFGVWGHKSASGTLY